MNKSTQAVGRWVAAALVACAYNLAVAQAPAASPLKLVVPYSPGGLPDTVARILSPHLSAELGRPVVVENKSGASGSIAVTTVLQAPADGSTLLFTDGPMLAIAPIVSKKMSYDMNRDLVPVSLVGTAPLFLAVNPKVPAKSLQDFVAYAKANPGALNYGSSGVGSIHHLTAEAFKEAIGASMTHIPFRGSSLSVPAMIGGQVDMVFASPPSLSGFIKSGQTHVLAINSAKRSALAPDITAISEIVSGFDFAFTVAVLGKAGSSPEVLARVSDAIAKTVRRPDVIERLAAAGVEPAGGNSAQLAAALKGETERMAAAARLAKLQPE